VAAGEQLFARTHQQETVVGRVIAAEAAHIVVADVAKVADAADVVARWQLVLQRLGRTIANLDGGGYGGYNLPCLWHEWYFVFWLWLA